jgi:uncharacterized membrane protein YidH (DUF202 family)
MRRSIGYAFVIIGILMMIYTGFNYMTTEKVVDLGTIQIDKKENHPVQWSPILGLALLFGGVMIITSGKKTDI